VLIQKHITLKIVRRFLRQISAHVSVIMEDICSGRGSTITPIAKRSMLAGGSIGRTIQSIIPFLGARASMIYLLWVSRKCMIGNVDVVWSAASIKNLQ